MTPRFEIDIPEHLDRGWLSYDIGGCVLLPGTPDPKVRNPMELAPEFFPSDVRVSISPEQFEIEKRKSDYFTREHILDLASRAVAITLLETPVEVADTGEGMFIITTPSRAVTELLHLFFETHGRRMYISRDPLDSADITLTTVDREPFDHYARIGIINRAIFRTSDAPIT